MTERLYYDDPYLTTFSARVVRRLTREGHPAVVLDRTAFYPLSGGQPADGGTLGDIGVLDVAVQEEDGAVVHVLERDLPRSTDEQVSGEVDWERRFDHMQQHTGQHILSAAFERLLDAHTVGFHLGAEVSTVDIDLARLDPVAVTPVEELANRVIWEDRPVRVYSVGAEELTALPLRRAPAVEGRVRIVEIADLDVNPCGGTHVARTGEIGLLSVVRLDYRGDQTRVEFLCGGRALRDYRAKSATVDQLSTMLTVGYWELTGSVERLQGEAKCLRQELRRASSRLLQVEAGELLEAATLRGTQRLVVRAWEKRAPAELRALAQALVQRPGVVACLAAIEERTQLCFARSEDVDVDAAALLHKVCEDLGGRGGGQPHLAQGSAPAADRRHVQGVLWGLFSSESCDT